MSISPERSELFGTRNHRGSTTGPEQGISNREISYPTTPRQLKAFCGISYYRRFIPDFSRVASSLYKLLKKDTKFEWTQAQENGFQHLKSKLMKQSILQYPDFSKQFVLTRR